MIITELFCSTVLKNCRYPPSSESNREYSFVCRFCVCEEDKEVLEKAWQERQHEDRHTRKERIRNRAIKNWKMIIKKVICDMRLKKKYKNNLDQES